MVIGDDSHGDNAHGDNAEGYQHQSLQEEQPAASPPAGRADREPAQGRFDVPEPRLRRYVQERLAGRLTTEHGVTVAGPAVPFTGRNRARLADRRWGQAWSPEQIDRTT